MNIPQLRPYVDELDVRNTNQALVELYYTGSGSFLFLHSFLGFARWNVVLFTVIYLSNFPNRFPCRHIGDPGACTR